MVFKIPAMSFNATITDAEIIGLLIYALYSVLCFTPFAMI